MFVIAARWQYKWTGYLEVKGTKNNETYNRVLNCTLIGCIICRQ